MIKILITSDFSPIRKTGPNIKAREECIELLKQGYFNALSLSNNHIMDHGEKGLLSTMRLCKNNIDFFGAGRNLEEASQIFIKTIKDKKCAFINISEDEFSSAQNDSAGANPLNPLKNYYSIKTAREKADYVIVIIHEGHEGYSLPSPRMMETCRFFIDSGVDFECFGSRLYRSLRLRKYFPSLLSKREKLRLINLLHCKSHRDLAIESLKL